MSVIKATQAFTFREGGKVNLYKKGDELSGNALAHAQAAGFAPKPVAEKPKETAQPAGEAK